MKISECYKIGFILKPHGLKGGLTISVDEDFSAEELRTVFIEIDNNLVPYFIEEFCPRGDKAFIRFDDVNTVEQANAISKKAIYLPKSSRVKSGRGEFYDDEIIDFEVEDATIGVLGRVTEITNAGPNKLLLITSADREILIPLNGPFIKSVNKSKRKISVELPEGYLEI